MVISLTHEHGARRYILRSRVSFDDDSAAAAGVSTRSDALPENGRLIVSDGACVTCQGRTAKTMTSVNVSPSTWKP